MRCGSRSSPHEGRNSSTTVIAPRCVTLREALALWRGEALGEFLRRRGVRGRGPPVGGDAPGRHRGPARRRAGDRCRIRGGRRARVARRPARVPGAAVGAADARPLPLGASTRRARRRIGGRATVLVEEMGIEPGRELRALEAAILEQDPALDLTAAVRRPGSGCRRRWNRSGRRSSGEMPSWPGCARRGSTPPTGGAASCRCSVRRGSARRAWWPSWPARCSAPAASCCTPAAASLAPASAALLDEALGDGGASLDGLDGVPVAELGRAVMQVLATESIGRPVLLALDDVHLADADTIEVLADLAAWSDAGSLLVVATFRADADVADPPEPGRGDVGAQLVLRGLDRDALRRVCEMYAADGWWPDDIERLQELTGGVPLRRPRAGQRVGQGASASATSRRPPTARRPRSRGSPGCAPRSPRASRASSTCSSSGAPTWRHGTPSAVARHGRRRRGRRPVQGACRLRGRATPPTSSGASGWSPSSSPGWPALDCWPSSARRAAASRHSCGPACCRRWPPACFRWPAAGVADRDAGRSTAARPAHGGPTDATVGAGRRLVFVDQFEELFTTGLDRREQAAFVDERRGRRHTGPTASS